MSRLPRALRLASRSQVSFLPEPLRIPAFRYFWLARLATTIAQMAMVIVIGWQVYDIARHTMGLKEPALRWERSRRTSYPATFCRGRSPCHPWPGRPAQSLDRPRADISTP